MLGALSSYACRSELMHEVNLRACHISSLTQLVHRLICISRAPATATGVAYTEQLVSSRVP